MNGLAPFHLALSVVDASSLPDTDAALRFVLGKQFASLAELAEYCLHTYQEREAHDPPGKLVRQAAADLLVDLEEIRRAARSPLLRRIEPSTSEIEPSHAVVNTRAVLADLAMRHLNEEATTYLLGLFDRVRAPAPDRHEEAMLRR